MSETNNETAVRSRATSTTSPSKAKLTPLVPGKEDPNRPLVELTHVEKHFGALHVLKDINLTVAKGEVLVVVGPSGSGKSTMCRTINRLETIDSGDIRIDGKPLPQEGKELANLRAEVGMVFQSFNLFANKTILENVTLALIKVRHMDKKEAEQLAMDLLARVGVDSQASKMPSQLSGGQQQRVAIARAIVSEPRLLLLDEPLSNLDAKLRVDMRSELKRLHHDTGSTIIYVTHDQVEALTMSTKIALFREGELVQVDKPLELYDNPCDLYTADFIGNPSINFVEASGTAGASGLSVDGVMGRLEFSREDMTPEAPASGDLKLVLGIRPEQITISREKTDAAQVEARVYAGMPAGSETLVSVRVGEKLITVKELGSTHYAGDETVYLSYPPKKVNVFDASTKRLIKYSR